MASMRAWTAARASTALTEVAGRAPSLAPVSPDPTVAAVDDAAAVGSWFAMASSSASAAASSSASRSSSSVRSTSHDSTASSADIASPRASCATWRIVSAAGRPSTARPASARRKVVLPVPLRPTIP